MATLEAIERLAFEIACCRCQYWGNEGCSLYYKKNKGSCIWVDIKEELKALEIIKEKKVNVWAIVMTENADEYNFSIVNEIAKKLTKEEYDLLKEIFNEKD